ncbi:hypothetical protein [uncultured virus]|uniref:Uncharacterized protein n=1 Tax=uncultured virus TaxID=340016 RepID=A0A218ML33_9VIRU|nr:hypothetical protein [uncultured virus]
MANKRYNKQVPGFKSGGRVAKMGGGMMMNRPMMNKGGSLKKEGKPGEGPKDMGSPKTKSISSDGKRRRMKFGGSLKPVDKSKNPGLAKLPTDVRNKMGFMKKGGRVGLNSGGDVKKKKVLSDTKVGMTYHPITENSMRNAILRNFSSKGKSGASTGDLKKENKKIKEKAFDRGLRPTEIAKMDKEFNARIKRATKDARFVLKNRTGMSSYRKRQQKAKATDTGSEN